MMQTNSIRWATWFAISGGVFWIAFHLYFIFSEIDYLELGAAILLAALGVFFMALTVISLMQSESLGNVGRMGAGVLLAGMLLVFLGATLSGLNIWGGAWLLAIGGEALTTLGLVAFSIGMVAEEPRGIWRWLPLILAPVYFVSFSTTSDNFPTWTPAYTSEWFGALYGVGWIILALLLPRNEASH